jgi:hypothetical protein
MRHRRRLPKPPAKSAYPMRPEDLSPPVLMRPFATRNDVKAGKQVTGYFLLQSIVHGPPAENKTSQREIFKAEREYPLS